MMSRLFSSTGRRVAATIGLAVVSTLALPGAVAGGLPAAGPAGGNPPAAAPPGRAAPSVAVGRLAAQGCQRVGTTTTCELYAAAGTVSVVGSATIPVWGFSTSAAGPVTAPGPVLVVNQGDAVSVTVHNNLPGTEQLSLAFPGIAAAAFDAGLSVQATQQGVAPTASATYSFRAGAPGTYLYEAGHTANGARQVAMGLAGALVVLPADGTAYGTPGTAYDDEAVVVLSEIDPALNADPNGFDMRTFHPAYRLINGNAFPEIPAIATGEGRAVLLRYVNAGSQQHPMSLLGATQKAVARAGRALTFPEREVIASMDPGATEDVVVTMPSGAESKVTLFETGTHLDNNAQHGADPLQFAFGGMMTVLDTAAPPPSTDTVGPVASGIAVSPNPATGLADVTVSASLSDATTGGSFVDGGEFVLDDPRGQAPGTATAMALATPGAVQSSATGTLSVVVMDALVAGKHVVYVRAHDAAGNWGVVGSAVLNRPKTGPATTGGGVNPALGNQSAPIVITATGDDSSAGGTITAAEYVIGDDPTPLVPPTTTPGSGIPMTLNRVSTVVALTGSIPTTQSLGEGKHHAWVRSHDSLGLWGPLLDVPFTVDKTGPTVDGAAFGPDPTNGLVSDRANPGYAVVSAKITDKDASGGIQSAMAAAEAFLDPPAGPLPTGGSGLTLVPVDGVWNSPTESVYGLVPLSQIRVLADGAHHIVVRGKDAAGNWGAGFTAAFQVDRTAPVLTQASATSTPNPTNGAAILSLSVSYVDASATIGGAEFWVGAVDPGAGRGTALTVSLSPAGVATLQIPLAGVPAGLQTFSVRIQDKAGNWSNVVTQSVTVVPPPLVSENFNIGGLTAGGWTSTGTAVSVTAAANLPSPATGTAGLQVVYPTTAPTAPAYISKALGASVTTMHVSIDVKATALATGAATPTIFAATSPTNAQVFSLQLRTLGGVKQVRTTMTRNGGGVTNGAWVTLPAGTGGSVTIALDWLAGPATGAAQGSLLMRFGPSTTVVSTSTGNTSAQQVAAVGLGVVSGTTNAVKGTLYLDNLTVTR